MTIFPSSSLALVLLLSLFHAVTPGRNDNRRNLKDLLPENDVEKALKDIQEDMKKSQEDLHKRLREDFSKSQESLVKLFVQELKSVRRDMREDLEKVRDDIRKDLKNTEKSLRREIQDDIANARKSVKEDLVKLQEELHKDISRKEKNIQEHVEKTERQIRDAIKDDLVKKHTVLREDISQKLRLLMEELAKSQANIRASLVEDLERKHKNIQNDLAVSRENARREIHEELTRKHAAVEENLRWTREELQKFIRGDLDRINQAVLGNHERALKELKERHSRATNNLNTENWLQLKRELKQEVKEALGGRLRGRRLPQQEVPERQVPEQKFPERDNPEWSAVEPSAVDTGSDRTDSTHRVPLVVTEDDQKFHRITTLDAIVEEMKRRDPVHWDWGGLVPETPSPSGTYMADWSSMTGAVNWRQEWASLMHDEVASLRFPPLRLPISRGGQVIWMWLKKSGASLLVRARYHYPFTPHTVSLPLRGRMLIDVPSKGLLSSTFTHLEKEADVVLTRDWSTIFTFNSLNWNRFDPATPPKAQFILL